VLKVDVRLEPDEIGAAHAAAMWCAQRLRAAVGVRGRASVALSGGSTPGLMFDALVGFDLPWEAITVLQVDERIAPDGDPDRNATQLVDRLLRPASVPRASWRLMPVTAPDLDAAAADYARVVDAVAPIDVVHLGLGDDGHTASWPPGDPVVDAPGVVALSAEYRGRRRMTLTPIAVNAARWRAVLVTGATKAAAVARWLAGDPAVPAHRIATTATFAFLDEAAGCGERH
jgi:6-phosphogluconolactonase